MRIQLDSNWILLKNTGPYPDKYVAWLVKFAAKYVRSEFNRLGFAHEFDRLPIALRVTKSSWSYAGRFMYQASGSRISEKYGFIADPFRRYQNVLVRVGRARMFPVKTQYPTFKDMPEGEIRDWQECVIAITAHELCHIHWPGGKDGETNCELVMLDTLTAFRNERSRFDAIVAADNGRLARNESAAKARLDPQAIKERRLADAHSKLAGWLRKLKLAQTKVKKYQRTVKRLSKPAPILPPLPLAEPVPA